MQSVFIQPQLWKTCSYRRTPHIVTPLATKVHPLRHVDTTQLHTPKLTLVLRIYQECDRREGDNKGSECKGLSHDSIFKHSVNYFRKNYFLCYYMKTCVYMCAKHGVYTLR